MIKKRIIIDIEIKSNGPIYDADSEDGEGILFNDQQVESVTLQEYSDLVKETCNPYGNEDLLQKLSDHLQFDASDNQTEDIVNIDAKISFEDLK